jgi:hypothetical protein
MCFVWFSEQTTIISLNNTEQLIFVMDKYCVFFEVGTGCFKYFVDKLRASKVKQTENKSK